MIKKTIIPPIKSQGIKSKLIPWIKEYLPSNYERWIEPFMGTGVVGFNLANNYAIMADNNPHIISFYDKLNSNLYNIEEIKEFLIHEGNKLLLDGEDYYYKVRERFNNNSNPLDFLFINRSCFNGMIRFNKNGKFNIPYCHKDNRFSKSYITKIINQIYNIVNKFTQVEFIFKCQDFLETIELASNNDLIYCDPPYIDRHVDYFNSWNDVDEFNLYHALKKTRAKFILSTWHHNRYRNNIYINKYWKEFNIFTKEHFYHVGAKESNRNIIVESIITNYDIDIFNIKNIENNKYLQCELL